MGDLETQHYANTDPYGEAQTLARTVLKGGTKMCRDCYRYHGQIYWIVNGRVLTREQAEKLEAERRREGRAFHPSDRDQHPGFG